MSRISVRCPTYYVASVTDIPAQFLLAQGIRTVVLDLDNTLAPVYCWWVDRRRTRWVTSLIEAGLTVHIASHVPHWFPFRINLIGRKLGVKASAVNKKRLSEFQQFLESRGCSIHETVVIDDQLLRGIQIGIMSDVAMTILVKPITVWEMPTTMWRRRTETQKIKALGVEMNRLKT